MSHIKYYNDADLMIEFSRHGFLRQLTEPHPLMLILNRYLSSLHVMNITVCFCFVLQSGETALHVAARYGNVDVVQYLCSIHANPDLTDRVSKTRQTGKYKTLHLKTGLMSYTHYTQ